MKKVLAGLALAGLLALGLSGQAQAQALGVKCNALSGTRYMCVKNASNYPVTSIQAGTGWAGTQWIPMPGGTLMPGETTIVAFDSWGSSCPPWQNVYVRDMRGVTHPFYHLDVCHFSGLVVR